MKNPNTFAFYNEVGNSLEFLIEDVACISVYVDGHVSVLVAADSKEIVGLIITNPLAFARGLI